MYKINDNRNKKINLCIHRKYVYVTIIKKNSLKSINILYKATINYAKIEFLIYTFHYSSFYSFEMQCDQCNDDLPNQIFYFLLHGNVHTLLSSLYLNRERSQIHRGYNQ